MVPLLLYCSYLGWGSICHHMLLAFLVPTPLLGQTFYERLLRKFDVGIKAAMGKANSHISPVI